MAGVDTAKIGLSHRISQQPQNQSSPTFQLW